MLITKPTSKRYIFHYLNNTQYINYARGYSLGKRNDATELFLGSRKATDIPIDIAKIRAIYFL